MRPLADLCDDLDEVMSAPSSPGKLPASPELRDRFASAVPAVEHKERCSKCSGSGVWRSWSGYRGGKCFACKGAGFKTFRTSSEQREKARVAADGRKTRTAKSGPTRTAPSTTGPSPPPPADSTSRPR